jgi:hypothetical protein
MSMWIKRLMIAIGLLIPISVLLIRSNPPAAPDPSSRRPTRPVLSPPPAKAYAPLTAATYAQVALSTEVSNVSPVFPNPGVYRTEPFAGIVIVPSADIDSAIALAAPEGAAAMPMLNPELRFIPLDAK